MSETFILIASIACFIACFGDFLLNIILGFFQPNYSHLEDTMSELATKEKPFTLLLTIWWVIFGVLFIVFAVGFGLATDFTRASIITVVILISLFGLGAGIFAGLFPMNPKGHDETTSGKIHGITAGLGFMAILIVPIVSIGYFTYNTFPGMFITSLIVQVLGLVFLVLFVISERPSLGYSGLWQRLFLLNSFGYLIALAVHILVN